MGAAKKPGSEVIEVRVSDLQQMFHAIDPSPYRDRELDPGVEEFIVTQAADLPGALSIGLLVYVDRPPSAEDAADLTSGIHKFFSRRAATARRELRELLRRGRVNLVIGLAFLTVLGALARVLAATTDGNGLAGIARESLLIGGWVAMWRPMEMLLYDWWPIRAQAKRYDRLAVMPVSIRGAP